MHTRFLALVLLVCSTSSVGGAPEQAILGHRSAPLLTVDGLTFKDLDRNGKLDPYEDWRLPANVRAADLVQRMSLEELAGLMAHGTLPSSGPLAPLGVGKEYDLVKVRQFIEEDHVSTFITRLNGSAEFFAKQNNEVQAIAESSRLGIQLSSLPIRGTTLSKCWEQAHRAERSPCGRSLWASPRSMIRN
jgi:beta-glucosidase